MLVIPLFSPATAPAFGDARGYSFLRLLSRCATGGRKKLHKPAIVPLDESFKLRNSILRNNSLSAPTSGISMTYPHRPGYKARSTSKAAAKAIGRKAMPLRERVYEVIRQAGKRGTTADEAAELLRVSILSVRPRVSELVVMGRLTDTMERRANKGSGRHAIVWRAK